MALRAIPNLHVFRPADANETVAGWRHAMSHTTGPVALVLSRQDLPVVTPKDGAGAARGGYVVADGTHAAILATGSEVWVALAARDLLAKDGVSARVVSMPCWELFDAQDATYRESVLPRAMMVRVSVEAGITFGWREYVGEYGASVGIDRYGASAPGEEVLEKLGINATNVANVVRAVLTR
jgi:transketolase